MMAVARECPVSITRFSSVIRNGISRRDAERLIEVFVRTSILWLNMVLAYVDAAYISSFYIRYILPTLE